MLSWNDFHAQEQKRQDLLVEAEQARLVKLVASQKESALKKVSNQVRRMVGSRLVKWGDALQSQPKDMSLASQGQ